MVSDRVQCNTDRSVTGQFSKNITGRIQSPDEADQHRSWPSLPPGPFRSKTGQQHPVSPVLHHTTDQVRASNLAKLESTAYQGGKWKPSSVKSDIGISVPRCKPSPDCSPQSNRVVIMKPSGSQFVPDLVNLPILSLVQLTARSFWQVEL